VSSGHSCETLHVTCILGLCAYGYVRLGSGESSEDEDEEKAGEGEEEVRDR
jgi:hypothetical protein